MNLDNQALMLLSQKDAWLLYAVDQFWNKSKIELFKMSLSQFSIYHISRLDVTRLDPSCLDTILCPQQCVIRELPGFRRAFVCPACLHQLEFDYTVDSVEKLLPFLNPSRTYLN
ncbi:MAG TPA: hypothetical protein VJH70_00135 [Candidatus Paceibacterota bacterium]